MGTPFFRYADTTGDGTGTKSATGNYSGAADDFLLSPGTTEVFDVHRMIVFIEDGASTFTADNYGGLAAALTNGVSVLLLNGDDTTKTDLTDGLPVKTNAQWRKLCYDAAPSDFGSGNDYLGVRWTFARAGEPLRIDGRMNEKLAIRVNDDLTGLVDHTFMLQGISVSSPFV